MTVPPLPYEAVHGEMSMYCCMNQVECLGVALWVEEHSPDAIQKPGTNVTKQKRSMGKRVEVQCLFRHGSYPNK